MSNIYRHPWILLLPLSRPELDLEKILRETPAELRCAMLLRYGSRSRWSDVATVMAKSTEAARKLCGRELRTHPQEIGSLGACRIQADCALAGLLRKHK